jgi:hypothetical protein
MTGMMAGIMTGIMTGMDWQAWHDEYDDPRSPLARRLRVVRERVRAALDVAPPGPLRLVSLCAGQGRDVVDAPAGHPRRTDVRARLVELDPRNCAYAERSAAGAGLDLVDVVTGDASRPGHYRDLVPADVVLVCGVFGNITDEDVARVIGLLPAFCRTGGTVIWTRHRDEPDLVPRICRWFEKSGFAQVWLSEPGTGYGVGAHRFTAEPPPLPDGGPLFTFVGYDVLERPPVTPEPPGVR